MHRKYKNTWIAIAFFLFVFVFSFRTAAAEGDNTLKVGYVQDYGILVDEDGTATGYLVDYLNEISKYTGWNYQYIEGTWSECLKRLEDGSLDLLGMVHKVPEREEFLDFSEREMGIEYGTIYISEKREDIFYNDPKSLDGVRIASTENSFYEIPMEKYCRQNGIAVELLHTDAAEYAAGLAAGTFEAVLGGSTQNVPGGVVAERISADPFYFAIQKGDELVMEELNSALDKIFIEDAYFDAKLFERHFGNKSVSKPAFSLEEAEYLDTRPVLNVVCNPDWVPISFTEEEGGRIQGIAIDLLNKLCVDTGITVKYSTAKTLEEGLARIKDGSAQLMIGYEQNDDASLWYTDSILDIPMVIASAGGIQLQDNIRVGIHSPEKRVEQEIRRNYPQFEYVDYPSVRDILKAMKAGEEQYAIFNYYAFGELQRSTPGINFQMSVTEVAFPVFISVSKNANKNVLSILNKAMKRISPEEISAIAFENSMERNSKAALAQMLYNNRMYILLAILLAILAVGFIIAIINYKNKKILQKMAYYDELTGVYSIDKFRLSTEQPLKSAQGSAYSLVALDINKFKYINDTYGYGIGDRVLIVLAEYLKAFKSDYCCIGRISADNFVVLLNTQNINVFFSYLEELNSSIHSVVAILPLSYKMTYSLGYYVIRNQDENFNTRLDKVNFARKQKRADNINNITEYTDKMDEEANWKKDVTMCMEEALAEGQFLVYYQPKYDFATEKLAGAEALVRWQHPKHGMIAPARFIPIFEQNGFIQKLDLFMFEEVCRFLAYRLERGYPIVPISSNLSRIHMENENLAVELDTILRRFRISPEWVEVELTEGVLLEDQEMIIHGMKKIRELGLSISIDDFGSGYSSLSLLSELPVNVLKIDKIFVEQATNTESGKKVIQKIIELAKIIDLHTVAEGVETKQQVEMLRRMGCELAQGYFYSRPVRQEQFEKLLEEGGAK